MRYLVTGGTGSFGRRFVKHILDTTGADVTVFSRNEYDQWVMGKELHNDRVRFIIGDVRDRDAVRRAMEGADYCVHAAALKHVALGEVQPWEVVQTNAHGTWNVVQAANEFDVTMVLLSTDKAVMPVNLYGATKMCAERITLTGGQRVVRYGNVIGSRGSVLHIFKQQAANGHVFSITDKRMTRFVINFAQAIWQVEKALRAAPGSITIPVLPAIRIVDLALAFDGQAEFREIGVQPGEKIHEVLSVDPWRCSEDADKLSVGEIKELIDATV